MSTNTSKASEWLANYPCPWWVDTMLASHIVRDLKGDAVCCLPVPGMQRASLDVQIKTASLISYAPEMLTHMVRLLDVMRRTDREFTNSLDVPLATDEEWDAVIEDAQGLLDCLVDEGVTLTAPPGDAP